MELDICCCISIVSQLLVIVETIVVIAHTKTLVPCQTMLLPVLKPLHLGSWLAEELHLHLFELTHTEDKLTCNNLVTESLTNLADTERQLHTTSLLYVEEVYEDTLCCLWAQINLVSSISRCTYLSREHKIELTNVCPVSCTTDWVYYTLVKNNLLQSLQVWSLHSLGIACMKVVTLLLIFKNAWVSLTELSLIERLTELLSSLSYFLLYLLLVFTNLILDKVISTITLL